MVGRKVADLAKSCMCYRRLAAPLALVLASGVAVLMGAASTAQAADAVQVAIDPVTSSLYVLATQEDDNGFPGNYAAVDVSSVITNCPTGYYTQTITVSQDGYTATGPFGGLGEPDLICNGEPLTLGRNFYNPQHPLHPGLATVTVWLQGLPGGDVRTTSDVTIPESAPTTPTSVTGGMTSTTSASVSWQPPMVQGGTITGYRVSRDGGIAGATGWSTTVSAGTRALSLTNLVLGRTYTLSVAAINSHGTSPSASASVVPGTPGLPTKVAAKATSSSSVALTWSTPAAAGSSSVTGYRVSRDAGAFNSLNPWSVVVPASTRSYTFTKLLSGDTYTLSVAAINVQGSGSAQPVTRSVPVSAPNYAPTIGDAVPGASGGAITASATWSYPATIRAGEVTGYVVRALRMSATGSVLSTTTSAVQPVSTTSLAMTLPQTGNYRFTVQAMNDLGGGPQSAQSNLVAGR